MTTVVAEASGKALVTGGYLVLERAHAGLVLATDARFKTTIRVGGSAMLDQQQQRQRQQDTATICVASPQFGWRQTYRVVRKDDCVAVEPEDPQAGENPYVETTLRNVVALAEACRPHIARERIQTGLYIEILGANDFYSQRDELSRRGLPLTHEALLQLPPFCVSPDASLAKIRKTGLGSSAALITSLTGALMVALGVVDWDADDNRLARAFVHNTAQFCHCLAQGKIGSGFDVSSAVYGSHQYHRFSPSCIDHLLAQGIGHTSVRGSLLQAALDPALATWDTKVTQFTLPRGVYLLLGDISTGSSTPSMVSKLNAWRAAHPAEAAEQWARLSTANDRMEALLRKLAQWQHTAPDDFASKLEAFAAGSAAGTCETVQALHEAHATSRHIRTLMRTMGEAAEVPIEPPQQTRLLDATMNLHGVIAAGVPGAGGYDAVYVLVATLKVRQTVLELWSGWSEMSVCPLLCNESSQGLSIVKY